MRRFFISKPSSEILELSRWLEAEGLFVDAHSFLHFSPVLSPVPSPFDVIFFSSPRSVIFFLAQHGLSSSVAIACTGEKTAEIVRSTGRRVDFVGEGSDMATVAEAFKLWCKGRSVLFPVSTRSLGTMIKIFPEDQRQELIVYETTILGKAIPSCEMYAFTSPSNVEGFLLENSLSNDAKIIAWGKSTAGYMEKHGITPTHVLKTPTSECLKKYLHSIL